MPTVYLQIRGKVQGVFYRASARDMAEELGVTGWVRNAKDGHVEAAVSGSQEQVDKFINWCRKGPPNSIVSHVDISYKPDEIFDSFRVVR
jgi:acylphosphatase